MNRIVRLAIALTVISLSPSSPVFAASYAVTTGGDNPASPAAGSLRKAILDVNAGGGTGNTIEIAAGLGTITLAGDLPVIHTDVVIDGHGATIDGANTHRGLFIYRGTVTIANLTIRNTRAQGGRGGNGAQPGGAGAGLGGAVFVASEARVTLQGIAIADASAAGGAGGATLGSGSGGGGGMGGNGGTGAPGGGGGGLGRGADGGNSGAPGSPGIAIGLASGGSTTGLSGGPGGGGGAGGTGSAPNLLAGAGGGIDGLDGLEVSGDGGGTGGLGGGGGAPYGSGGLGGGGGALAPGGFGGGGGADSVGGFGGGASGVPNGSDHGGGGGGLGAGGAIFVQRGGLLTLRGHLTIDGSSLAGGSGGTGAGAATAGGNGSAFGSGIFLEGDDNTHFGAGEIVFAPAAGETQTISDDIADQTGSGGTGLIAGTWRLVKAGTGTLILGGANTYSGGTMVYGGTLTVTGSIQGTVTVASGTLNGTGVVNGDVILSPAALLDSSSLQVTGTVTVMTLPLQPGGLLFYGINQYSEGLFSSAHRVESDGSLAYLATIPDGLDFRQVAVRGDQSVAYFAGGGRMVTVDTRTHTIVDEDVLPAFGDAIAVSPDGAKVYVADRDNDFVVAFSAEPLTGALTVSSSIPVGDGPVKLVVSPDGSKLFVANVNATSLTVIDTATDTVDAAAPVPLGGYAYTMAIDRAGTRLYVLTAEAPEDFGSLTTESTLRVFDAETLAPIGTPFVTGIRPDRRDGLVVSRDGAFLYVRLHNGGLMRFDVSAGSPVLVQSTPAAANSTPALSPDGRSLYLPAGGTVEVFDVLDDGALAPAGTPSPLSNLHMMAMCTDGNALLAGGRTFVANTAEAILCTANAPAFTGGTLRVNDTGLAFATPFVLGAGGGTLDTNGHDATIAGVLSGGTTLTKVGAGVLTLSGANTYTGATAIVAGTLQAGAVNVLGIGSAIDVGTGAVLNLSGFNQTVASLSGQGHVALGGATLTAGGGSNTTFTGTIDGAGGFTKTGTGVFRLEGNTSYPGATTITAGGFTLTGTIGGSSAVTIANASFSGTGVVTGPLTANASAIVSPGLSPGQLSLGGLTLNAGSRLDVEINGALPAQYDRLVVTGAVALGGALSVTAGFTPSPGQVFTIVDNDGSDAVTGTFAGLPEQATFSIAGKTVRISYAGGAGGNDVTLTVLKANQTITFGALANRLVDDPPFPIAATSDSGLDVTLEPQTTAVCTIAGGVVTLVGLGTCTIEARQAGDANYNPAAPVTRSFSVGANCSLLSIQPGTVRTALAGSFYSQGFDVAGGAAPSSFTLTGALPSGLTFSNGVISGTPSGRGAFPISITGTDANACQVSTSLTLGVSPERRLVVGAGGGTPTVRALSPGGAVRSAFEAYAHGFAGGVSVAQGDINNDGVVDIVTGAGPGGAPHVLVFDGTTGAVRTSFLAFEAGFSGGVEVATGDVTGDGIPEILAVASCGGPAAVRAFNGQTGALVREYAAPPYACRHVAAGDVNGDGIADPIVGAGAGSFAIVTAIDGYTGALIHHFPAYVASFLGGVYVAAGDVNGDGFADIVTGAAHGGAPHVRVFDGVTGAQITGPLGSFFAYEAAFPGGVRVAAGDLNGDGRAEVITGAGPGGGPHVRVFDGTTGNEILGTFAFDPSFPGGVFVSAPPPLTRMSVDLPPPGVAGTGLRIAGWALKQTALDSPGVDVMNAWALPVGGGAPIFVAGAVIDVPRPDVADVFGGEFLTSGFDVTATLAPGTYDLAVFVRNSRTLIFDQLRIVRITVNGGA